MTINDEIAAAKKALPLFRVSGIALVVDQIGKGAQMVLRYPVGLEVEEEELVHATTHDETVVHVVSTAREDLFFQLSPRVLAKLFRPKKSLCGQPMTLSVGGTVFCCRAILLESNDDGSQGNMETNVASTTTTATATSTTTTSAATAATSTTSTSITASPVVPAPVSSNNETKLVLFSVIVALTPTEPTKSIPISGWFEGEYDEILPHGRTEVQQQQQQHHVAVNCGYGAASSSARSIRRVHLSLARLCRALEREERRCRFVSAQSNHFFRIRSDINKAWEERMMMAMAATATLGNNTNTSNNNNPSSSNTNKGDTSSLSSAPSSHLHTGTVGGVMGTTVAGATTAAMQSPDVIPRMPRHNRSLTATSMATIGSLSAAGGGGGVGDGSDQHSAVASDLQQQLDKSQQLHNQLEQEKEQEILEQILASHPSPSPQTNEQQYAQHIEFHGNLARDLVQVYHSLSRDDPRHKYPKTKTPGILLHGGDAVVYVNGHIAVPIESAIDPVGLNNHNTTTLSEHHTPIIRPYHTLLFPRLSQMEWLETLQLAASSPRQQKIQQLLSMISPTRSLNDVAIESNESMSSILDMGLQLIHQGICTASPIISRSTRLACAHDSIIVMKDVALEFGQTFFLGPGGNIFVVVSYLTFYGWTLGDALSSVSQSDNERASLLRSQIQHHIQHYSQPLSLQHARRSLSSPSIDVSHPYHHHFNSYPELPSDSINLIAAQRHHEDELEDVLFDMAVWLVSHRVLVKLEEYLVLADSTLHASSSMELNLVPTVDSSGEEKRNLSTMNLPSYFGTIPDMVVDEHLFKVLKEDGCLDGTISLTACAWKLGTELHRLRSWVLRHEHIILVERIPSPGDDWGVVY